MWAITKMIAVRPIRARSSPPPLCSRYIPLLQMAAARKTRISFSAANSASMYTDAIVPADSGMDRVADESTPYKLRKPLTRKRSSTAGPHQAAAHQVGTHRTASPYVRLTSSGRPRPGTAWRLPQAGGQKDK